MEKHVFELATGLLKRNVDVQIICEDRSFLPDPARELQDRVLGLAPAAIQADGWIELYREKSLRFAEMLDPSRFDVVHCHSHYGRDVALTLSALHDRPRLVTTFHLTPLGQLQRYRQLGIPEPEGAPIDREVAEMEGIAARHSDVCIAVSHGVGREVTEFYGVPPDGVEVIYNWYDPGDFEPRSRSDARSSLALGQDAPYLLYIGHFDLHRGQLLAETMRRLPPEIRLLVVHPEADREIQSEFGNRIQFVGYLPPEQLALYYAASDLQCFPAVYSGFGLVLVEGMACGCPPVVFDYSAMNEIVTPQCGYLVADATPDAYAAAILQGLSEGGGKRPAAVARSRDFRKDPQIDRVLDLYESVTDCRSQLHGYTRGHR